MATTPLDHTIRSAFSKRGFLDAKALAVELGLTPEEMAKAVDRSRSQLNRAPDSPRIQADLRRLVTIASRARALFAGSMESARVWLNAPHPEFGNERPNAFLIQRRPEVVEALIGAIEEGYPD
jgi:uncharacterized protein (DUF2384 family)